MSQDRTKRKAKSRRHTPPPEGFSLLLLKNGGLGLCIGLLCVAILLPCGAALCYAMPNPHALLSAVAMGILYASSLVGGWSSRQLHGTAPLSCGLISGGGMLLLWGLISCFLPKDGKETSLRSLLLRMLILPLAFLGAYLCHKKATARRRTRRR